MPKHPKLLVIGGSVRCGKSTLAHKVAVRYGIEVISGDAMRLALAGSGVEFLPIDADGWGSDPDSFMDAVRDRDAKVAAACAAYARHVLADGRSIIVEGCIWADSLERFRASLRSRNGREVIEPDVLSILIFNTSSPEGQLCFFKQSMEDPASWLNRYTEEQLEGLARANHIRGCEMEKTAREGGVRKLGMAAQPTHIDTECRDFYLDLADGYENMPAMLALAEDAIESWLETDGGDRACVDGWL